MKFDEFVPIDYTLRSLSHYLSFLFSRIERSIGSNGEKYGLSQFLTRIMRQLN